MHRISICLALLAGFALAQECPAGKKECSPEGSCPTAKSTDCPISKSLATARKAIADAPKAEESLAADQRAELVKAREYLLKETSFGRSLAPTYEACAHLLVAAAAQEGTNPAAQAVLKEMCATYCSIAKSLGGCSEKECCDGAEDCCAKGTPAEMAKTAKDQAMKAKELLKTGKADFEKVTP
jgi:hypothetical protein